MTDIPDSPHNQNSQTFKVGSIDSAQNVSFLVREVNNVDATHIKISEDKLALILERNKDKLRRSIDDYDFWPWISLLSTAVFNIATCVPIAISSTFKDGWGRVFDIIAFFSVF